MSNTKVEEFTKALSQKVILAIENGCNPWKKSWDGSDFPYNGVSGRNYTGINSLQLSMYGFSDPRFYSYKQAKALGTFDFSEGIEVIQSFLSKEVDKDGKPALTKTGKEKTHWNQKLIFVWNHEQITFKDPEKGMPLVAKQTDCSQDAWLETWLNNLGVDLQRGMPACARDSNKVYMPSPESFTTMFHYMLTLGHELTHFTGRDSLTGRHKKQAEREVRDAFRGQQVLRSLEELVAEIGASLVASRLEFWNEELEQESISYLRGWIKRLQDDPHALVICCAWACTAVQILFAVMPEQEFVRER